MNRGMMGVNSLPKTVTGQRRDCDLNPGPSAPESSTLTTQLPSHPWQFVINEYVMLCYVMEIYSILAPPHFAVRQAKRRRWGLLFCCCFLNILLICLGPYYLTRWSQANQLTDQLLTVTLMRRGGISGWAIVRLCFPSSLSWKFYDVGCNNRNR